MRHLLRKSFDSLIGLLPVAIVRGLLKSFYNHAEYAERAGFQVYPRVFYSPFPDPAEVNVAALARSRQLPGVPIDETRVLALLRELAAYKSELNRFPRNPDGSITWSHTYPTFDTATLYTTLRRLKPRHYVEVGCGWSTRVSTAALERNREEGAGCEAVFIEPYPGPHLLELKLPGQFLQKKIQAVPLEIFLKLEAGDVLFIDTSHILKVQNDVEYELTQ